MRAFARHLPGVLALSFALIGCSGVPTAPDAPRASTGRGDGLANGSVVDNIRLGNPIDCPNIDPECETRLTLAKKAAIERHGIDASAIGEAHYYLTYLPPGAAYGSSGGMVVVFDLADGSQAAVQTVCFHGCYVVDPQPVAPRELPPVADHGPLVDPLVEKPADCASADHPTCDEAVAAAIAAATKIGFLAPPTSADTHYHVTFTPAAQVPQIQAEYVVDMYVAGPHDVLAEMAFGVSCDSGPCQVVWSRDTSIPPEPSPVPES